MLQLTAELRAVLRDADRAELRNVAEYLERSVREASTAYHPLLRALASYLRDVAGDQAARLTSDEVAAAQADLLEHGVAHLHHRQHAEQVQDAMATPTAFKVQGEGRDSEGREVWIVRHERSAGTSSAAR